MAKTTRVAEERRYARRKAVKLPATFRILHEGSTLEDMRLSDVAGGEIRDLGPHGVGMHTAQIIVDGVHIARLSPAHAAPRVFLQCLLPGDKTVRAVGRAVRCEQLTGTPRTFQVGLRLIEISPADRAALQAFIAPRAVRE